MFESIINFFKNIGKKEKVQVKSKDAAKERLHLVLMQDRANVSADFLDLMKQEIIEVIKKYIDVDENAIDVRLTNKENGDGTTGAPALYANIPIVSIKEEVKNKMARQQDTTKKLQTQEQVGKTEENKQDVKEQDKQNEISQNTNLNTNQENNSEIKQEEKQDEIIENKQSETENETLEKENIEKTPDTSNENSKIEGKEIEPKQEITNNFNT